MSEELKQIKKIYGEEMAHLCRELFPTILEKEGTLLKILQAHLAPTKSFASDIKNNSLYDEFKNWIYYYFHEQKKEIVETKKNPFELMDEAGYTLYECHSEEEIQSFRKYYAKDEVICTINMGGRLNRCYVFFAVKKNVDEIKREDFDNPEREDEYGTSVISIQFSKGSTNTLSIKNRYNHTVSNPDATFNNNLENIIPGLTKSFEKYYGYIINQEDVEEKSLFNEELDFRYVRDRTGKYYLYNLEVNGIYYCENNVIIDGGEVISEYANNKGRYLVIENYIVDRQEKKIFCHFADGYYGKKKSSFIDSINDVGEIKNIDVVKKGDNRVIIIKYKDDQNKKDDKEVKIEINKNNAIVGYENNYVKEIGDFFLNNNRSLKSISLNNVKKIGAKFLLLNLAADNVSLNNVKNIGVNFMNLNRNVRSISLPKLEEMSDGFLERNIILEEIYVPKVKKIGKNVLLYNKKLKKISLPEVLEIDDNFLHFNESDNFEIHIPKVKKIHDGVLTNIKVLNNGILILQNVEDIGDYFLSRIKIMEKIIMSKLKHLGSVFAGGCQSLKLLELSEVEEIGEECLYSNKNLGDALLPKVKKIKNGFLYSNRFVKNIYVPNLTFIDTESSLSFNEEVKRQLIEQVEYNEGRRRRM